MGEQEGLIPSSSFMGSVYERGCLLINAPTPYAKIYLFVTVVLFKTIENFSIKSGALRRGQPLLYTESFLSVLSFNAAPYFHGNKLFLFNF